MAIVKQHNDLVDARYSLNLAQSKIFAFMASRVFKQDHNFSEFNGTAVELCEAAGICKDYKLLRKNLRGMHRTLFTVRHDGYETDFTMFHEAKYKDLGDINIKFHEHMKPLLLNLKNNFTIVELEFILRMKSYAANRLYFLLKRWAGLGEYTTKIEDLKKIIYSTEDMGKHKLYGHFKNRVLMPAIHDINGMTDLLITFRERKKGRAVASLVFEIKKKPPAAPQHKTAALIDADHRSKKEDEIYTKQLKEFLKLPKAEQGDWIEAGKSSLFYIPGAELEHAVHLFVESKNKVADVVQ